MKPSPQEPSDPAFYELQYARLLEIATSELHMDEQKAMSLVHDVLVTVLFRRVKTADLDVWLEGALRSAAARLAQVRS